MSEVYDVIEISIPVHRREEEQNLDDVRSVLSDELEDCGGRRVMMEKEGQLPEMEVTITCHLTGGGTSWRKVRMLLTETGLL